MLDAEQFETPEDVVIDVRRASPVARFGAYVIDRILLALIQFAVLLVLFLVGVQVLRFELSPTALIIVLVLLLGFSEFVYFGWFEWRRNGSTPGKKASGLRAIRDGGYPLDPGAAWLRNLFRPVDLIPVFWLVPILDKRGRRLGDLVAGTIVVHESQAAVVADPFQGESYRGLEQRLLDLTRDELLRLRWQDFQALQGFFSRIGEFDRPVWQKLARNLATQLLNELDRGRPASGDPTDWLREIYLALRDSPGVLEELDRNKS